MAESEEGLRALQAQLNAQVNELRRDGKGAEARELRAEVLRIAGLADEKQRERYAEYEHIAQESEKAESVAIAAEAAAAVSEAERLLG